MKVLIGWPQAVLTRTLQLMILLATVTLLTPLVLKAQDDAAATTEFRVGNQTYPFDEAWL